MSKTFEKPKRNPQNKGGRPKGTTRPVTAPPSDLDRWSKRFWERTLEQLREQRTWQDSDVPLLESYVRACESARHARAKIPPDGTTKGSQGQLVEHPAIKTAREAERDAHKYREALILTPDARRKAAIEAADAPTPSLRGWLTEPLGAFTAADTFAGPIRSVTANRGASNVIYETPEGRRSRSCAHCRYWWTLIMLILAVAVVLTTARYSTHKRLSWAMTSRLATRA